MSVETAETGNSSPPKPSLKAILTRQFYAWHWVSSALCLVGMLFFAFTGITLNHAGSIKAKPKVTETRKTVPPEVLESLRTQATKDESRPLPASATEWIQKTLNVSVGNRSAQWSKEEIHLDLPRPGGDAWLNIDLESGEATHELTSRGFISYLNDLHKGRHTGKVWFVFLDVFSVACIVFTLTGLALLYVHAKRRPMTWPAVLAGVIIPIIIALFFIY